MQILLFTIWAFLVHIAASQRIQKRANSSTPLASLRNGSYYGIHDSKYNEDYFLGIPFAQPPLDELRFQIPQSLNETWTGTRPATGYAEECIGYGGDQVGYLQSEVR